MQGSVGQHCSPRAAQGLHHLFPKGEFAIFETRKYLVLSPRQRKQSLKQKNTGFHFSHMLPSRPGNVRRVWWPSGVSQKRENPFSLGPPQQGFLSMPPAQLVPRGTKQRQLLLKNPMKSQTKLRLVHHHQPTQWGSAEASSFPLLCAGSNSLAGLQEFPIRDTMMFLFLCLNCYDSHVTEGDISRRVNPSLFHPASAALPP